MNLRSAFIPDGGTVYVVFEKAQRRSLAIGVQHFRIHAFHRGVPASEILTGTTACVFGISISGGFRLGSERRQLGGLASVPRSRRGAVLGPRALTVRVGDPGGVDELAESLDGLARCLDAHLRRLLQRIRPHRPAIRLWVGRRKVGDDPLAVTFQR